MVVSFQLLVFSKKVVKCAKVPKVLKLATLLRGNTQAKTLSHTLQTSLTDN